MIYSISRFTASLLFIVSITIVAACNGDNAADKNDTLVNASNSAHLAKTPPMGWNSWNVFGKNLSEQVVRETVDAMVSTGLKDLGYEYIVLDDFWQGGRDSVSGILYADSAKFPSGMKALADYIHSKGLKFGIYSDAGTLTCGGMPGSYTYEEKDAKLFAEWGVDYLKYDYCYCPDYVSANNDYKMAISRYKAMGDALQATGRPIVFSLCEWGPRSPWLWGKEVGGHLWRTTYDVADIWDVPRNEHSPIGILTSIDAMADLGRFSGPAGWNDPDMLVIGLNNSGFIKGGGCTETEYRTQLNMWCMFSAPLMLGCDIRNMSDATKNILLNKDIVAIDQDTLGKQGYRVYRKNGLEAWRKQLSGDRIAIALFNRSEEPKTMNVAWKDLELDSADRYDVYDVWKHANIGQSVQDLSAKLTPHESQVFILSAAVAK